MARGSDIRVPRGVFWRLTWRTLMQNRVRTVVTLVGITLACALVTAVLTTVTSFDRTLYEYTLAEEGGWYAYLEAAGGPTRDELVADERVDAAIASHKIGAVILDSGASERVGVPTLTVVEMPSVLKGNKTRVEGLMIGPELTEGRLPEAPDEIVLSVRLKGLELQPGELVGGEGGYWGIDGVSGAVSDGPLELGSTITLELGTRVDEAGEACFATDFRWHGDGVSGERYREHLEDVSERTYTVVGFRRPQENYLGTYITASDSTSIALTCAWAADAYDAVPVAQSLWISGAGFESLTELERAVVDALTLDDPDPACRTSVIDYYEHTTLIRYAGITDDRLIYESFWAIALVLVLVIAGGAVATVYTSFSIAGPERTRQFGLLASLGASRRQLRRIVLHEALLLALIAVPLGIGLGIAGVATTLDLSSEAFSVLLETESGMVLHVEWPVIAATAVLAVLAILVSAWIPAVRASRSSAIDAIRQPSGERMGWRTRRAAMRSGRGLTGVPTLGRMAGVLRPAGLPGVIARRNLTRASARGWVVSISLGVSFALFVSSGVVARYFDELEGLAQSSGAEFSSDIVVNLYNTGNATHEQFYEASAALISGLDELETATVTQTAFFGPLPVQVSPELVGSDLLDLFETEDAEEMSYWEGSEGNPNELNAAQLTADGGWVGNAEVFYVGDDEWARLVEEARAEGTLVRGVDAETAEETGATLSANSEFATLGDANSELAPGETANTRFANGEFAPEADAPDGNANGEFANREFANEENAGSSTGFAEGGATPAIPALILDFHRSYIVTSDGRYLLASVGSEWLQSVGARPASITGYPIPRPDGVQRWWIVPTVVDGEVVMEVSTWDSSDEENEEVSLVPIDEVVEDPLPISVIGTTSVNDPMTALGASYSYPVLVMPQSVLYARDDLSLSTAIVAADLVDEMEGAAWASDYIGVLEDGWAGEVFRPSNDVQQVRAISWMLRLFTLLFSCITLLISVANAFNTLVSGMALREREFATLRSVGMGPRAFRRMIAWECVSYALRGLVIGMALSLIVNVGVWWSFDLSIEGVRFAIPWGYVLVSVLGMVVVLGVSTLFALHSRSHSSVVDSLRMQ